MVLLNRLQNADTVFLYLTERNGQTHDTRCNMAGTVAVIERLGAACGFSALHLNRDTYRAAGFDTGTPVGIWTRDACLPAKQPAFLIGRH